MIFDDLGMLFMFRLLAGGAWFELALLPSLVEHLFS